MIDPTGKEITWDKTRKRAGQWDMGHIPGEKYSEKHRQYMSGEISKSEFLEWLFTTIEKQKNNPDKRISVPIDLVGSIFLQYIQDNFDAPYGEIKDESPNLIEFYPTDLPTEGNNKAISSFQFKYFKENCPEYILYLFKDFCSGTMHEEYWYRSSLQYLLKIIAPDCKIVVKNSLYYQKGEDPFQTAFCTDPIVNVSEWKFPEDEN